MKTSVETIYALLESRAEDFAFQKVRGAVAGVLNYYMGKYGQESQLGFIRPQQSEIDNFIEG